MGMAGKGKGNIGVVNDFLLPVGRIVGQQDLEGNTIHLLECFYQVAVLFEGRMAPVLNATQGNFFSLFFKSDGLIE